VAFTQRTWVDVPDESNPPAGAIPTSAAELNRVEQGIADAHAHADRVLLAHSGTLVYVEASTVPPANPPAGLLWYQTDGVKRLLQNEGTPAAPVWIDVTRDKLIASDLVTDYVVAGLLPAVPSPKSLSASVPDGQAYVIGRRVAKDATTLGFTANQDTYVDLDRDGVYRLSAVARGAAAPAVYVNSIRLFTAATDANVAQVDTVTVATVLNSTIYTVRINGVDVSFTSDASATAGEIALGLVAAINASTDPAVTGVTAATTALAADAAATLTITADVAGTPFTATVGANLTIATTTANNTAGITAVTDLRDTEPTVRGAGGTPPAVGSFSAYASVDQTGIVANDFVKVAFGAEHHDVSGWYDAATSRYTPKVAGYYEFSASAHIEPRADNETVYIILYKNGARFKDLAVVNTSGFATGDPQGVQPSSSISSVYANGTTDYFEIFVYHTLGTSPKITGVSFGTWFTGRLVGT
jgi:hypothetical protein